MEEENNENDSDLVSSDYYFDSIPSVLVPFLGTMPGAESEQSFLADQQQFFASSNSSLLKSFESNDSSLTECSLNIGGNDDIYLVTESITTETNSSQMNSIKNEFSIKLLDVLLYNTHVKHLIINVTSSEAWTEKHSQLFEDLLNRNENITTLSLDSQLFLKVTNLKTDQIKGILKALNNNGSLTSLNLNIPLNDPQQCKMLCDTLKTMKALASIKFSLNLPSISVSTIHALK